MKNTLHTPGPWYIAHHTKVDGSKSIDIRKCVDIPTSAPEIHQIASLPEDAMANARLISSAPDLLSALETLLSSSSGLDISATHEGLKNCEAIAKAREAIRKAKGEA